MNSSQRARPAGAGIPAIQSTAVGVAIVLAAGLIADLVLWPRDQLPPVADVDQYRFFTLAFVERAQAFRGLQSWLAITGQLLSIAVAVLIACNWPRRLGAPGGDGRLDRWVDRRSGVLLGRGGPPARALVAAGVALLALSAALPFEFVGFLRARHYGLSVQSVPGWLWSWLLATLLALAGIALLALLAGALIRRLGRSWWAAFGVCLILLAVVYQALAPVLIEPMFADFTKAPPGALRNEVESIARKSGVRAGEIYTVDAASRTTGANAYVAGLGTTKRVVIYDTLLKDFTPAERRQVIAHEFGHARHHDLVTGLLWFSFVAMLSLFAVDLIARALAARCDIEFDSPAALAMVLAAALIAIAVSQPAANAWSRAVEARADAFALRVTQQPAAGIALERRLTVQNIARPEPPALLQFVFGTHPTPMQRIGMAVTVQRELASGKREPAP